MREKERKKIEYRLLWKREGLKPKHRDFKTKNGADRYKLLFGDKPWEALGVDNSDEAICCSGAECGCGGKTYREESDANERNDLTMEISKANDWQKEKETSLKRISDLENGLALILPLAKGYVALSEVGSNKIYIEIAEKLLRGKNEKETNDSRA